MCQWSICELWNCIQQCFFEICSKLELFTVDTIFSDFGWKKQLLSPCGGFKIIFEARSKSFRKRSQGVTDLDSFNYVCSWRFIKKIFINNLLSSKSIHFFSDFGWKKSNDCKATSFKQNPRKIVSSVTNSCF